MPTLSWLTRDEDLRTASRVPYRLLEEARDLSAGDPDAGNVLIQGDNLEALKALLPFYAGRVKCICIDPPYNTGSAFEHYDDNLEHTQWLAMMWPRLELLRDLLAEDGSIWVSIDDNEAHYLKVIMDEIFGRKNFVANVVWQKKSSSQANATWLSDSHDHILVVAKDKSIFRPRKLPRTEKQNAIYKNSDHYDGMDENGKWYGRGPWFPGDFTLSLASGARGKQYAKTGESENIYPITTPSGRKVYPAKGRAWAYVRSSYERLLADHRVHFGKDGNSKPTIKRFLSEIEDNGVVALTTWPYAEVGENRTAAQEVKLFDPDNPFTTPKPERLIQRIFHIATNPGDLVLDSFLGSGTTAAVAHKMGRRYIGIEMGEHAVTHCVPRLRKVIDGEQGGISKSVGWQGGGGFRFYRLGPPVFNEEGQIRADIRFPVLAAHVWFSETGRPWSGNGYSPFLGLHDGHAYALLYNGILGDKRPNGGNVLTRATLATIREEIARKYGQFGGPLTVYGEQSRLASATLERAGITFKQMPYDVKART